MTDNNSDDDSDEKAGNLQGRLYSGTAREKAIQQADHDHTLYDLPEQNPDLDDVDWDKWRNDVDTDEGDVTTHTCVLCGWVTEIETPKIKTTNYCQGECGGFTRFVRSDKA
jgi:hypothetical protein